MTKQQRLLREQSERKKKMFMQSRYLRKTGERVETVTEEKAKKNPFKNEAKIFSLKKEAKDAKEAEIARRKSEKAERQKERENRAKKFRAGKNRNGQPKLGNKIQDILEILQKENSQ